MHDVARTLSAATIVAALWVGGCSSPAPNTSTGERSTTSAAAAPSALPPPEALTAVLYQLADPSIPADRKVALVQSSTPADEPALANFATALADGGFGAIVVRAEELTWAQEPGNVTAKVTISAADDPARSFAYPMEFTPTADGWQLTRRTADQVLVLEPTTTPEPPR